MVRPTPSEMETTMMTARQLAEEKAARTAVTEGVKFLDRYGHIDWDLFFDLSNFDVTDPNKCAMAYGYPGGYYEGLDKLAQINKDVGKLGFCDTDRYSYVDDDGNEHFAL